MLLTEMDYAAIAILDLIATSYYEESAVRAAVNHREVTERGVVEEALLKVTEKSIQLLTRAQDVLPVSEVWEYRGEGLHSVGHRAADCMSVLNAVVAEAMTIDGEPRPSTRGMTVTLIRQKGSLGTLIELVQE
jgi:hypothetical protein